MGIYMKGDEKTMGKLKFGKDIKISEKHLNIIKEKNYAIEKNNTIICKLCNNRIMRACVSDGVGAFTYKCSNSKCKNHYINMVDRYDECIK